MPKTQGEVIKMLNSGDAATMPFIYQWRSVFYRTSIHTTGTCPRYFPLRYDSNKGYALSTNATYPAWWISAHYDEIFDTALINRYPREPEITREYRKSVYRPYQTAPLLEAISSLSACIFGDSKYTLVIDDPKDNEYINGKNFGGKTFIEFFEWNLKAICEDPNSLFMVYPKKDRNSMGDTVEPAIMHIPSVDLIYITEDEVVFYEPNSKRQFGWFVNSMGYFRFTKNGSEYVSEAGENDGYYAHMMRRTPLHFAGGIWNTMRYYDSYLKAALPYCDDFVAAHSDVQMINKEACFPFIQMVETDCPTCTGFKEVQYCHTCLNYNGSCSCTADDRRFDRIKCPSCQGSGQAVSFNPGQHVQVPKDVDNEELIKIINFDVNINKFLHEYANDIKECIKKSLHQQYVDEAQSGVAKEIDREAEYLYRSFVSNGIWNLIEACLIDILSLRHTVTEGDSRVPKPSTYELVKPSDFALKTDQNLLEEYKESTDAKMPDWVRQKQMEQYVDKVFGGDDTIRKKVSIINQMDPYSVTPIGDKSALLSANGITLDNFIFSNNLPNIIDKIIRDKKDKWFLSASYEDIQTIVQTEYALITKPTPITEPSKN